MGGHGRAMTTEPREPAPAPPAAGGLAARPVLTRVLSPAAVGDAAADVEVVLPRWPSPDDVHLHLLRAAAGPRRWRRPRASPGGPRAGPGERALLLHLPAFGRDLYLQLRRDLRFLSPAFQVEEAGAAGSSRHPTELCFYSGRVLGHPGSLVSLSACGAAGGLVLPAPPMGLPCPVGCVAWGGPAEGWAGEDLPPDSLISPPGLCLLSRGDARGSRPVIVPSVVC